MRRYSADQYNNMLPGYYSLAITTACVSSFRFRRRHRWTPVGRDSGLLENVLARAFVVCSALI